jgi:curved DNA-binding protein CbpA
MMKGRAALSLREAADILGIGDKASISEIRVRYRELVRKWHPDISEHGQKDTHETMVRLNDAYDLIMNYCLRYEISFRPEDLRQSEGGDPMDTWMERYGDDPIWGPFRSRPQMHQE